MSAMFDDYDEFMKTLGRTRPLDEEQAQMLAMELISGLRGEEREMMLAVVVELVYRVIAPPGEEAGQAELDRWKRHFGIVEAIAKLAYGGDELGQKGKIEMLRRRRERAAAFGRANDPLPSPSPKEEDDEPTLAEIKGTRYGQGDYERWLAPIIYDLAHPEVPMGVDRADQLMRLLWVLEGASRAERDTAFEVAMSHAYNFTTSGRQQQVGYLARLVSQSKDEEKQEQEYNRLKTQEQIMAKLLMDTTPDAVIQATQRVLEAQLQLSQ